jgi:hypothetical protein
MTIFKMAVQEFDAERGYPIAQLDARTLMTAFAQAFDRLRGQARERDGFVSRCIADKTLPTQQE